MTIDITKPVKTRSGRKVTLISDKGRHSNNGVSQPLVGYVENRSILNYWGADGRYVALESSDLDLIQQQEVWLNVYAEGKVGAFKSHYYACQNIMPVVARICVTYQVGQFDNENK